MPARVRPEQRRVYVVACYDVSDNRRRTRLHEELLAFGTPVQRSVFECSLTPSQLRDMRRRAQRWLNRRRDSIKFYQMCGQCQHRTAAAGTSLAEVRPTNEDYVVN